MAALNRRKDYSSNTQKQGDKNSSLKKSKELVHEIITLLKPYLKDCEEYENDININGAPAVELGGGKKAIAPDILCTLHSEKQFWIEVKDKPQRFYHPDTGADIFQVLGWYYISKIKEIPVLVIFKDPDFESCLPKFKVSKGLVERFRKRWDKFGGLYYGNYLNKLLEYENNYPQISEERSRNLTLSIFYFSIQNMISLLDNPSYLIQNLEDNYDNYIVKEDIVAYEKTKLKQVKEDRIREITKESLKFKKINEK